MNAETYTKIFLSATGAAVTDVNVKDSFHRWFKNTRHRERAGGLRLTEEGFEMVNELELKMYEIPFHDKLRLTTQVQLFLDKFIDCPYYVTENALYVSGEKKAVELTMFSGDINKFGLIKAMKKVSGELAEIGEEDTSKD